MVITVYYLPATEKRGRRILVESWFLKVKYKADFSGKDPLFEALVKYVRRIGHRRFSYTKPTPYQIMAISEGVEVQL